MEEEIKTAEQVLAQLHKIEKKYNTIGRLLTKIDDVKGNHSDNIIASMIAHSITAFSKRIKSYLDDLLEEELQDLRMNSDLISLLEASIMYLENQE